MYTIIGSFIKIYTKRITNRQIPTFILLCLSTSAMMIKVIRRDNRMKNVLSSFTVPAGNITNINERTDTISIIEIMLHSFVLKFPSPFK
jgi:hypothetical protein